MYRTPIIGGSSVFSAAITKGVRLPVKKRNIIDINIFLLKKD
jgi:hypothetical protein